MVGEQKSLKMLRKNKDLGKFRVGWKAKKFEFGNNMPGYFTVLMLAMKGNAIPKL